MYCILSFRINHCALVYSWMEFNCFLVLEFHYEFSNSLSHILIIQLILDLIYIVVGWKKNFPFHVNMDDNSMYGRRDKIINLKNMKNFHFVINLLSILSSRLKRDVHSSLKLIDGQILFECILLVRAFKSEFLLKNFCLKLLSISGSRCSYNGNNWQLYIYSIKT